MFEFLVYLKSVSNAQLENPFVFRSKAAIAQGLNAAQARVEQERYSGDEIIMDINDDGRSRSLVKAVDHSKRHSEEELTVNSCDGDKDLSVGIAQAVQLELAGDKGESSMELTVQRDELEGEEERASEEERAGEDKGVPAGSTGGVHDELVPDPPRVGDLAASGVSESANGLVEPTKGTKPRKKGTGRGGKKKADMKRSGKATGTVNPSGNGEKEDQGPPNEPNTEQQAGPSESNKRKRTVDNGEHAEMIAGLSTRPEKK
ncbi:hypothetical protein AAF712_012849 [Marasmius tenuissimus]|uniref:Uncharacterized protein n=1 Tax=Marasmius tenuissimus TaxID=585030 RepID=A0ABR2ZHB7_9AGAR